MALGGRPAQTDEKETEMAKPKPQSDDVKVKHKKYGCPIDQRRDQHTHTQKDWRKVVDEADPFRKAGR